MRPRVVRVLSNLIIQLDYKLTSHQGEQMAAMEVDAGKPEAPAAATGKGLELPWVRAAAGLGPG